MSFDVLCKKCGEQVTVPASHGRPRRVRCPECDSVCDIAGAAPVQENVRAADRRDASPTENEDDENPYPVPRDPEQKEPCPHCRKPVPMGAIVCNRCGFNRETGTLLQRQHEKVAKEWQTGLALNVRLSIFATLVTITLTATVIFAVAQGNTVALLLTWIAGTLLLSFLLGTCARLKMTRSKKGQVKLTKTWRICFIPWKPEEINWRGHEGVSVYPYHKADASDYFMFLLLLFLGVIPGIVWWLVIVHPDQYDVALTKDHGTPATLLYRGRSAETARDIADSLRNVTDLK